MRGRLSPDSDFIEGAVDQCCESSEAAFQHIASGAGNWQVSYFEGADRKRGSSHRVAQFLRQKSKALIDLVRLLARHGGVALDAELSHGIGNGIVQAPVQGAKFG